MSIRTVTIGLALLAPLACGDDDADATTEATTTNADASAPSTSADASTTGDPSTESSGESDTGDDDVWSLPYCASVSDDKPVNGWLPVWQADEEAMLELVNEVRATPTTCGANGTLPAAPPLTMADALRCAARRHSVDMSTRDYFDHISPEGEGPGDRVAKTGYSFAVVGENIAGGLTLDNPEAALAGLLGSDDHCAILMGAEFTEFGAGHFEGDGSFTHYWTQSFARPN